MICGSSDNSEPKSRRVEESKSRNGNGPHPRPLSTRGEGRRLGREESEIDPTAQYDEIAELYDGYPGDYTEDIGFFVEEAVRIAGGAAPSPAGRLKPAPPAVLEIGAGTGRLSLCLAAAGVEVVCLDSSLAMLRVLARKRRRMADLRPRLKLVAADMRRFALLRRFPLVMVPFRTFLYLLTEEDQRAALGAIREHLAPGGKLIMSFFVPPPALVAAGRTPELVAARFRAPDGRGQVVARDWTEWDPVRRVVISHISYEFKGETRRHELTARYVFPEEVPPLLAACGYEVAAVYGGFDRRPLGTDSREQIWVAERGELKVES
jgi:SAM-dependent methyltransferase